jgi:D-alanine-D-alanine ligase
LSPVAGSSSSRASPPLVISRVAASSNPSIGFIVAALGLGPWRHYVRVAGAGSSSDVPNERPIVSDPIRPLTIPEEAKKRLRIMFIAKHAKWAGGLHPEDGNHALYHVEVRNILEGLGLNLVLEDRYDALFDKPDVDFVFPLLNRGGFLNSEMMLPLLCTRHGIPFLGASPILRGMSDDKHLTKMAAAARDIPTAPWAIFRRGAPVEQSKCPVPPRDGEGDRAPLGGGGPVEDRWVIKPNASSASWGVQDAHDWAGVEAAIADIHSQGHDAIVEPFLNGSDVEVPVITDRRRAGDHADDAVRAGRSVPLRTYYEKRDLVDRARNIDWSIRRRDWMPIIAEHTRNMAEEFRPFDYGRFEFRLDREAGKVKFLEVNLNANLWSEKVYGRSAKAAGLTQEQLIETILCESLARHGLL